MSLAEDIKKELEKKDEIRKKKKAKWQILKEYEKEIQEMIKNEIPLRKQVELILKNSILDKLDYKEYYYILVKHFGYQQKRKMPRVFKPQQKKDSNIKKTSTQTKQRKMIDPVAKLSEDVDLLDIAYSSE